MNNTGNDYLEMEVLTAIPQKLQLMLIEGALRFGNQARRHWKSGNDSAAGEALIRTQEIVAEIIGNLNPHENLDLVRRILYVYLFVNRRLIEANFERSETKLADALRVLEVERETWRLACRQAVAAIASAATGADSTTSLGQSFVA
jgi:flagellar protein FliS